MGWNVNMKVLSYAVHRVKYKLCRFYGGQHQCLFIEIILGIWIKTLHDTNVGQNVGVISTRVNTVLLLKSWKMRKSENLK